MLIYKVIPPSPNLEKVGKIRREFIKMTSEERKQHNNDISNEIISNLLKQGIEKRLCELSIQDLIVIQKNARWALEKKIFLMDESQSLRFNQMIEKIYSMIIDKLKSADKLYLIMDKVTKMPYLDRNYYINVFSEKEFADEALDYYTQQYRMWEIKEVNKNDIIKTLGQAFYMNGADGVLIDNGQTFIAFKASEIIDAPDFSNTHTMDVPVMNPKFLSALTVLVQEKNWRVNYPEKGKYLRAYEDEMIATFCTARFLIPVKGMPKFGSEHEVELKEKTTITIPTLSNGKNHATPVFTDWNQFNKVYSQDEWGGWIWKAEDLLSAPDDTIVVNSAEICFIMSKEMISQIFDIYKKEILPVVKSVNDNLENKNEELL